MISYRNNKIDFMGINVDVFDTEGLHNRIIEFLEDDKKQKIMYVNAHCMLVAKRDPVYRKILNNADLVYADGAGVVMGARMLGHSFPNRSTGADFMFNFCRSFAERNIRIYLIGCFPGIAQAAEANLVKTIPTLKIVGTQHGYFVPEDTDKIIENINSKKPHILLVGMGVPYQEKWIEENFDKIDASVIWSIGGLFNFLSGRVKRGPPWLLDHGFEWLCRFCVEPKRLWKRYLIGNALFLCYVLRHKFLSHSTKPD